MLGIDAKPEFSVPLFVAEHNAEVLDDLGEIEGNGYLPETQRLQLAKARVGQGLFRKRVMLVDPRCRVTGVDDARLLIASYLKPWRDSNNNKGVNGFNGIMLSPHIDARFYKRLITFEDGGRMLIHPSRSHHLLERWSISPSTRVENFRSEQLPFLEHHRKAFAARSNNR